MQKRGGRDAAVAQEFLFWTFGRKKDSKNNGKGHRDYLTPWPRAVARGGNDGEGKTDFMGSMSREIGPVLPSSSTPPTRGVESVVYDDAAAKGGNNEYEEGRPDDVPPGERSFTYEI